MQADWDACNDLSSNSQQIARFTCEFEACQSSRAGIDIFFEREHLKSATEHFRMEQGLQLARCLR